MASLKEIKGRISSVRSTLKITSAMKMVASAELVKAQKAIGNMLPYEAGTRHILTTLMKGISHPLMQGHPVTEKVALVCFSSNQALCGAFNHNAIRLALETVREYEQAGISVTLYAAGRKMQEAFARAGYRCLDCSAMVAKPCYREASRLGSELMDGFLGGRFDRVELIYNHFASMSSQPVLRESFLPFAIPQDGDGIDRMILGRSTGDAAPEDERDYIVEPDRRTLIGVLVPKVAALKMYAVLLDCVAAGHASRMVAMQYATDNGENLLSELSLDYNKARQQKITNEILDLAGGSVR